MKSAALFFQDPATPIMEGIVNLHNYIFFFLVVVVVFVSLVLSNILVVYYRNLNQPGSLEDLSWRSEVLGNMNLAHGTALEIIWTIIPSILLVFIAVPSFALLYSMDEVIAPSITLKVIGYQWYWSYQYSDYSFINEDGAHTGVAFDSYMLDEGDLAEGDLRLLEVDNEIVLPVNTHVRIMITGADVLHSWAIPSLGVKTDAVPGRLNQVPVFIKREGVFYGQCSELCGVNHGFMPIALKAVALPQYLEWISLNRSTT